MPQYLFVYHGGTTPTDPAEIEATMAAWGAWFQNMGPALEIPGNPVGQSHTVSADGVADKTARQFRDVEHGCPRRLDLARLCGLAPRRRRAQRSCRRSRPV